MDENANGQSGADHSATTLHVHGDAPATPAPTPTAAAIAAGMKTGQGIDALGRVIGLRKLNSMHRLDLAMLLGAEGSANIYVHGPASLAFMVTSIDGLPGGQPTTYNELRALIGKLDDEGLAAIQEAAVALGWAENTVSDPNKVRDDVKN